VEDSGDDLIVLRRQAAPSTRSGKSVEPASSVTALTWARNPQNLQIRSAHWKLAGSRERCRERPQRGQSTRSLTAFSPEDRVLGVVSACGQSRTANGRLLSDPSPEVPSGFHPPTPKAEACGSALLDMAVVRAFKGKKVRGGGLHPTQVDCDWTILEGSRTRLPRSTRGSDPRQDRETVSLTLQLTEAADMRRLRRSRS
jgi:hypothetical protein